MTKRRIVFVLVACASMALFAVRTLSETSGSNQTTKSSDAERHRNISRQEKKTEIEKWRIERKTELAQKKKEAAKKARQLELERAQKMREVVNEGRGLPNRKQNQEKFQEETAEIRKEFLREKAALGVTEDQWKLVKSKLEKVRQLRDKANSKVGLSLASGPSDNETNPRTGARTNVPIWQWDDPWKEKPPGEMTEAQKLAKRLIALVENKSATPEQFRRAIDALRKARRDEAEIERQLAEARRELCEILTTRQEAALVLMNSL